MTDPAELHLLAAIRAAPADRTARLVYADWLDEHRPDCDRSAATAEFVRLCCLGKLPLNRQWPRAAYHWLLDMRAGSATNRGRPGHFRRLLPVFFALGRPHVPRFPAAAARLTFQGHPALDWLPSDVRVGKLVETYLPLGPFPRQVRFHLTFDAGFLVKCDASTGSLLSPVEIRALNTALALDAPLCRALGVFR